MTTTIHHTPCPSGKCPSSDELDRLVHGKLPDIDSSTVTEHVGECPGCQKRMDDLATSGDPALSDVVRHIDKVEPPSNSAYWRAVGEVQATLTGAFPAVTKNRAGDVTTPGQSEEVKLDFLQPSPTPGRLGMLSTFDVVRVIGRGGMGVVLHGYDPCLQRDVALKILDPQLAGNEVARQRFCREARAAAAVSHDNIVAVHQVDEDEKSGLPFLVMQLVNGESLEQRLKRVGRLPVVDTIRIGAQAAAGLSSAHAGGLIHRDIKPGNILLEAGTDKVKLTDFGLARAAEDMKLTRTGFVAGTPLYMAPEQARGDDIDARADLFSLGSVLYEALAGKPPFDGKTPLAVLRRVSDEQHEPLSKLNPDVPAWLEDVIDRLLEKEPADRFATAAEVSDIMALHLTQMAPGSGASIPEAACLKSGSASWLSRRRKIEFCRIAMAKMAGMLALGAGLGGFAGWNFAPRTAVVAPGNGVTAPVDAGPHPTAVLPARGGAVWSVATTADGATIAVGNESGQISLWDMSQTPRLVFSLPGHKGPVWAADFTADGKQLVTASDDGTVKVWEVATGKATKSLPVDTSVRAAAISPSGNWVVVGDRFGTVRVFDLTQDKLLVEYQMEGVVNGVAFGPDELTVGSVASDGSVWLWEVAQNRKRFSQTSHTGPVYGLGFSKDGQRLATASWDQTIRVWDMNNGTEAKKIDPAHDEGVWAVQFDRSGKYLASAGQDGTVRLWDSATGDKLATFRAQKGTMHALRFAKNGTMLITGGRDGTVQIWDTTPYMK